MNSKETILTGSMRNIYYDKIKNEVVKINKNLANKLISLSKHIDSLPYNYTLNSLPKGKDPFKKLNSSKECKNQYENPWIEIDNIENESNLSQSNRLDQENENIYNIYEPTISDLVRESSKKSIQSEKSSLISESLSGGYISISSGSEQLGESLTNSNKEKLSDYSNIYSTVLKDLEIKEKVPSLLTHSGNYKRKQSSKIRKEQGFKRVSKIKGGLLTELGELSFINRSRYIFLKNLMAKSNLEKLSNQKEFYKIHYMGLLEKYNQAKRAYSTILPRMQILEIQNSILFEIISKIYPEDENYQNPLKEFIELKAFCIHSMMKLRGELGDNYYNIMDLIVNTNSTSEVRPWAKIFSGMFNFYEIKVDETLIQNLNTLYSINKMTQGS